jgi:polyhydroxyalkanoate depolymerase
VFWAAACIERNLCADPTLIKPCFLCSRRRVGSCETFSFDVNRQRAEVTRRYEKPAFDLATTAVGGKIVPIVERVAWEQPFCKLLHFEKQFDTGAPEPPQKLLIVAPMSGHHATLLRGTVEAFLPFYDVYITDWVDARAIPLSAGRFDLDDYIDYLISICETLSKEHDGATVHTIGLCQPAVETSARPKSRVQGSCSVPPQLPRPYRDADCAAPCS